MPLTASVQEIGIHQSPAKPNSCHVGTVLSAGPHWSPMRSLPAASPAGTPALQAPAHLGMLCPQSTWLLTCPSFLPGLPQ